MFSIIRWLDKSSTVELTRFVKRKNGVLWAKWHVDNEYYRALRVIAQDDDEDMLKNLILDLQGILHFPPNNEIQIPERSDSPQRMAQPRLHPLCLSPSLQSSSRLQSDPARVNDAPPLSSQSQKQSPKRPPQAPLQSPSPTRSPATSSLESDAATSTQSQSRPWTPETSSRRSWSGERSRAESRIMSQSRSSRDKRETSTSSAHINSPSHFHSQMRSLTLQGSTHRHLATQSALLSGSRSKSSPTCSVVLPVRSEPRKRHNEDGPSKSQTTIHSVSALIPERLPHTQSSASRQLPTRSALSSVSCSKQLPSHSTPLPSRSPWPASSPRSRCQVHSQSSPTRNRTMHELSRSQSRSPTCFPSPFPLQSSPSRRRDPRRGFESEATIRFQSPPAREVRIHQRSGTRRQSLTQSPLQSHLRLQSSHQSYSPSQPQSRTCLPPPPYNYRYPEEPSAPIRQRNCNPLIQPSQIPIHLDRMTIPLSPLRRSEDATPVDLIKGTNVFINRESLKKILKDVVYNIRCTPDPRELARRLMKNIVGCERLKGMTPKGDPRTGLPGIPEGPYYAVFDYVNALLPDLALDLNTYRIVMGKMCNWLRDPKKR